MSITVGSNIASLRGQRQLSRSSDELSSVFERLSSGQRINRASDDAAGLAISESLRAGSRVYQQAVRNLNDGISFLAIAEGSLNSLRDIVTRQQELAEQAANGVYGSKQREAIDAEGQALSDEFARITRSTEFNGRRRHSRRPCIGRRHIAVYSVNQRLLTGWSNSLRRQYRLQ